MVWLRQQARVLAHYLWASSLHAIVEAAWIGVNTAEGDEMNEKWKIGRLFCVRVSVRVRYCSNIDAILCLSIVRYVCQWFAMAHAHVSFHWLCVHRCCYCFGCSCWKRWMVRAFTQRVDRFLSPLAWYDFYENKPSYRRTACIDWQAAPPAHTHTHHLARYFCFQTLTLRIHNHNCCFAKLFRIF